ncbi:branched-chain amino acid transport system ATP-binding protein [Rhodococcus triatomae]|uniref:Branched-chain amino acid transport system ATP-binding protein n=1 Tax=Rhodococcus triatomae TaxID=300028 RepID=A0A1G8L9E5_9NOCA|nr:ABC transporter ATP-binding protein [Rhodococcus triatomae]QNG20536.1 ABC transporter ATP-binding protein [Rhodococcus triatomae]SDI52147.1 branched-chain amino acid transport system ATP-binding protein [Rhodococcus triatomae]
MSEPEPDSSESVFALSSITVAFGGIVALSDVSVSVRPGEVLGVIGPNGAGKTTLFNVACGFVTPKSGTVTRFGRAIPRHRPHGLAALGMGRTLQGLGLFDRMTVLDNVMIGADRLARAGFFTGLLGLPAGAADDRAVRERAMEVLTELRVDAYADRLPPSLPYAVRKRVALARALVGRPSLLLLDEPASGLSGDEMDELGELIRGLTESMSVMLVEHHMDLVMSVCDRLVVLDFGKVIASGAPDDVREDPAVLAAYLGNEVTA